MLPSNAQSDRRSQLLWQHYGWHLWVGLVIWIGAVFLFVLVDYFQKRAIIIQTASYGQHRASALHALAEDQLLQAILLGLGGLFVAIVGGLARHFFLGVLSRKARTRNELIWKSLLVFELSMALLAFIPFPIAYNAFDLPMVGRQFRVYFICSLPWLVATGFASRRLAAALGLPHHIN